MKQFKRRMEKKREKETFALFDAARKDPCHPFRAEYVFHMTMHGNCPDCFATLSYPRAAKAICYDCGWSVEFDGGVT